MKLPWFKFEPTAHRSDQGLRLCSLSARGLWVEMLCLMHDSNPRGHLLVNGTAPNDQQLAILTGTPPDQLPDLIGELETAGVFSRNGKDVIYSRRMTRDDKKARLSRRNGKSGGNPSLCNERGKSPPDKPRDKPAVKARTKTKDRRIPPNPPSTEAAETPMRQDWRPGPDALRQAAKHGLDSQDVDASISRFILMSMSWKPCNQWDQNWLKLVTK